MAGSRIRLWFFRIAFLYCGVLLALLAASSFSNPTVVAGSTGRAIRSLSGIIVPLASTTAISFLLSLDIELDDVIPLRMLLCAVEVLAIYSLGRWVIGIDYRAVLRTALAPGTAGLVSLPVTAVYAFLPIGGLILIVSGLTLCRGLLSCFKNEVK